MKGFCPRTISAPGTAGQSCPGWALAPSVLSAAVSSPPLAQHHPAQAFAKSSLQPWIPGSLATALQALREPGVMPRGKEPSAPPSFVSGGNSHAGTLTRTVDPGRLQPSSAGFVPGICELCRARVMPRVSTAHSTEGIESTVKSMVMSPSTSFGCETPALSKHGVIHGDFTGQKLQQKFVQGVGFAVVTPGI